MSLPSKCEANPQTCCQIVIDHLTQLVPPLDLGHDYEQEVTVQADIEGVCPEKVIVCGVLKKKIKYHAIVKREGVWVSEEHTKKDEIPFQCAIDREDANEDDPFHVVGAAVLCTLSEGPQNTGSYNGFDVAWKWSEKDVVKVCIRKSTISTNGA